jgi:hypothetical protein
MNYQSQFRRQVLSVEAEKVKVSPYYWQGCAVKKLTAMAYRYHLSCGHTVTLQGRSNGGRDPLQKKHVLCGYCEGGE